MTERFREFRFDSRAEASAGAASRIAELCQQAVDKAGSAGLVVSGGSTPQQCFERLSQTGIDWERLIVLLSDERWVPGDHADSNERMVRESLLQSNAQAASLLPIYDPDVSVDERCDELQFLWPDGGFACTLLGMGTDGHFASLFPNAEATAAALLPACDRFYVPVNTAASPHPRVSMTLAALVDSAEILLLMFGEEKRAVLQSALAEDSQLPIAHVLRQKKTPVSLYWAP